MGFRDDLASLPMGTPLGDEARPVQGPPAPGPTFGQQLTAQFRQSNLIASAIADRVRGTPTEVDPNFDLLQHLRDAGRERDWETYVKAGAFNARRAMAVDLQIAQEEDDRRTIATMPWWLGLTTGIAANLTDPTVLLPVGGAVRATTGGGYAIARSAAITGAATGAAIAVQEGALQDTQLTRGWDESLMNIGSGVVLGALLGGGVAAWLNRADRQITEAAARAAYGGKVAPPNVTPVVKFTGVSGTWEVRHGNSFYTDLSQGFQLNFQGARYGSVFGDESTLYLDGSGMWMAGRVERFSIPDWYAVEFSPRNALVITPNNVYDIFDAVFPSRFDTGEEAYLTLKDWAKNNGHDAIIIQGFEAISRYEPKVFADYGVKWKDAATKKMSPEELLPQDRALLDQFWTAGYKRSLETSKHYNITPPTFEEYVEANKKLTIYDVVQMRAGPAYFNLPHFFMHEVQDQIVLFDLTRARLLHQVERDFNWSGVQFPESQKIEVVEIPSAMANPQPVGAAATEGLPLEALRIKGTIAESLAGKFGWLSPNIRLAQSLSPYVRQLAQAIGENPLLMRGHAKGLTAAPGGAASRVASQLEARFPNTIVKHDQIYSDMVRSGQKMSYEDFNQRVGYALLNNTTAIDDNAFITRAAQTWRSEFFDPFLKDMLDSGALSPGNVQMNPGSYLPRQPIAEAFKQYPDEWRRRVVPALEAALMENYQTSLNTARARLAYLEQRRADLRMSAEDAARLIEGLQAQRAELETRAPELALLREVLKDYNAAIRRAAREGNREKVKALRAERDQLREVPGLRAFDEEIRAISARERRLTQSEGMQAQKAQDLADQLADLEERSVAALTRLLERGRATERKLQSLDPEKAQIEIDRLTLAYENVIEREVKSAARLHEQMAKLQEAGEKRMAQAQIAADKERAAFTESIDTRKSLKEAREEAEMDKALAERLAKEERRTQARIEEMRRIQARIEAIESVDRMQQAEALREANEMLVRAVAGRQLSMGEKAARLRARIARRDPKWIEEQDKALAARQEEIERRFMERWEVKVLGENVDIRGAGAPKFTQFATDVADELAAKYSGRMYGADGSPKSNFFEVIDKGPFKGRTNPIPDLIMDPPNAPIKFFNKDITEVAHLHARRVAGDIALARLNLGGPALREVFGETGVYKGKLAESYDALRAAVEQAPDAQAAYAALAKEPTILERLKVTFKSDDDLTKRKLLKLIADDEANAISDLKLLRDTVRATAFVNENSGSFGRISRVVTGFNYIRQMGGQVISQLTDLYRPAMVRGLLPFLRDGLMPLITNLAGVKASVSEAKLMNLVTNRAADHILLTMADIGDPLSKLSPIEKIVDKVTRVASRWNGARIWQDFVETIGSTMTQTHIMRVLRDPDTMKANTEYLTSLGLNPAIAERVAAHLRKHGEWQGGVGIANTQKWTEGLTGDALRGVENDVIAYRSAVAKEVDGMFSTRRAQPGAIPFFAQTPMGKMLLQFNSFNISSLTNVTIRGLQGDPLKLVHALVAMTTIGMVVRYIQALHGGQERFDRFRRNIEQNTGFWIAEALDANGIFAVPFWGANMLESAAAAGGMGRINPIKTPIMAMFGPVPTELQSTAAGRDVVTALGGPTAGLISNIPRAFGASVQLGLGDSPSKQQSAALQQVLPGGTYIGMRQLLQALNDDLPRR